MNEETKECAYYDPGGGENFYSLPEGWLAYYPDREYEIVSTAYGTCTYQHGDFGNCCQQLGLQTVTAKDIPHSKMVYFDFEGKSGPSVCVLIGISQDTSGISINPNTRQCSGLLIFARRLGARSGVMDESPQARDFCSSHSDWVQHDVEHRFEVSTPAGKCDAASIEECCAQLRYSWESEPHSHNMMPFDAGGVVASMGIIGLLVLIVLFSALGKVVTRFIDDRSAPKDGSP